MYEDKTALYSRIDRRVDEMMSMGLEQEVKKLLDLNVSRSSTSMQAIGYKELSDAIVDGTDISAAVDKIKMESRRYGKRQLTWIRRDPAAKWLIRESVPDLESAVREITTLIMN